MSLNLYSFFHLNLAYSAIEEEDRKIVIENCYWPLLRIIRKYYLPLSIELSAYTLEQINKLDPKWVEEFKNLLDEKICELIGCGYSQMIGPLVPSDMTMINLKLGNEIYNKLLGIEPDIALLNEQAFSKGLVPIYKNEKYRSIIMEWDNPATLNPDWDQEFKYYPQFAKGSNSSKINLIWNHSINFQKFQRYVHGEINIQEFLSFIDQNVSNNERCLSLYGNDIEVFDFRPGRYMTEDKINNQGEWVRIENLYKYILEQEKYKLIKTSEVLNFSNKENSNKLLNLSSSKQPIPVKKQNKYNILRWAVTGRNDIKINTDCYKIYDILNINDPSQKEDFKKLCFFWSSDFRTHITKKRWQNYIKELDIFKKRILKKENKKLSIKKYHTLFKDLNVINNFEIINEKNKINIKGKRLFLSFNKRRGLALESFIDMNHSPNSFFGTLNHGFYNDISYGADFYSGNLTLDLPGKHKVTDLNKVKSSIETHNDNLIVSCSQNLDFIDIEKKWTIDDNKGLINLCLKIHFKKKFLSNIRVNAITLNPKVFNKENLFFAVKNGGQYYEKFFLNDYRNIDYSDPLSLLISAKTAIGITDGNLFIGDNVKQIRIKIDKTKSALVGLIKHSDFDNNFFTRIILSAREIDDTTKSESLDVLEFDIDLSLTDRYKF